MKHILLVTLTVFNISAALPALAYIGPGVGAGTIAVVMGILASIVMAFVAVLWYPIKRLMKRGKPAQATGEKTDS